MDKNQNAKPQRKEERNFDKKKVKHDPQAESARAKFGKDQ